MGKDPDVKLPPPARPTDDLGDDVAGGVSKGGTSFNVNNLDSFVWFIHEKSDMSVTDFRLMTTRETLEREPGMRLPRQLTTRVAKE